MLRVLLTTCCPQWPLQRQTPERSGKWEEFQFLFEPDGEDVDAWVVCDNPLAPVSAVCNPQNKIFISWEPPEIRTYGTLFLDQFRWVQSCHDFKHRGLIRSQQSHPWHVGVQADNGFEATLGYDDFKKVPSPEKKHVISAAISSKAITPAHRQRLAFVKELKLRLGDDFHLLGRGHQAFSDKWQAVSPYRFHLVLENACRPNYLTEKLCDAFLANAYPFYFGDPNAKNIFPSGSFQPIDIYDTKTAIETICSGIEHGLDQKRQSELAQARRIVLDELNLFPMLASLLREKIVGGPKHLHTVYPKNHYSTLAICRVKRMLKAAA